MNLDSFLLRLAVEKWGKLERIGGPLRGKRPAFALWPSESEGHRAHRAEAGDLNRLGLGCSPCRVEVLGVAGRSDISGAHGEIAEAFAGEAVRGVPAEQGA